MWYRTTKYIYIIILVIILFILAYINKDLFYTLYEGIEGAPSPSESIPYEPNTTDNRRAMNETNSIVGDTQLQSINGQIDSCMALIDELNRKIPYKIQDIRIGDVSQSDDDTKVGIDIKTDTTTNMNPITNSNMETALWTLSIVLPKGKQGPQGIQGPRGNQGPPGDTGIPGDKGQQGPWGNSKECSTC